MTATVVCCILMQILCVVSQKASASGGLRPPDPLPGLRLGPRWGTSVPQTPSLPLCPPNNPVRSTPLDTSTIDNGYGWPLGTRQLWLTLMVRYLNPNLSLTCTETIPLWL